MKEGRTAAGKLLIDLQVRKSTADGAGARKFYTELTTPLPGWDGEIRDIVLKKKLVCPPLQYTPYNNVYSCILLSLARSSSNLTPSSMATKLS